MGTGEARQGDGRSILEVAIETSRREASVAVGADEGILEQTLAAEREHASDLLPHLERLLARLGRARAASVLPLSAVFVGTGPGSYTGLRVGIATALGLARAAGAPCLGVPSFEVQAWAHLAPGEEGSCALDARGGAVYHARYRRAESELIVLEAPSALDPAELRLRFARPGPILADERLARELELPGEVRSRLRPHAQPRAGALLALGRARLARDPAPPGEPPEPLYLRDFGARSAPDDRPARR